MQLKQFLMGSRAIVYDADRIQQPDARLFQAEYWESRNAIAGTATGRGNALLLDTPFGSAVLRRYLRGGFAARLSRDRYLFLGFSASRPIVEAHMLAKLLGLGLPVPEVLAAQCVRQGLTYSGALLTRRIPQVATLADLLPGISPEDVLWSKIGACIQRFHAAGVYHADLNTRNVLVDADGKVWLIDFDRARIMRPGHAVLAANLQRLQRSLVKEDRLSGPELELCWRQLMFGYNHASEKDDHSGVEAES